jgi:biopolymer transport protein TolQ
MLDLVNFVLSAAAAAPVDQVSSLALSGSAPTINIDMSISGLFMQADAVVKVVMLVLIIASVCSWAIIFDKWFLFKSIRRQTRSFEDAFWSGQSLENLYEKIRDREGHPMARVFSAAMHEWQARNVKNMSKDHNLRASTKERIHQAMQVSSSKSLERVEKNLNFLATVGSNAVYIGLFGTVWGIMVSFQSIAISKNTTLAVVAPGIAEALLATAFGLIAAIPAGIFYNKFVGETNRVANNIDDFSSELGTIISRELDNL